MPLFTPSFSYQTALFIPHSTLLDTLNTRLGHLLQLPPCSYSASISASPYPVSLIRYPSSANEHPVSLVWTREIWIFSDSQAALKRLKSREVRAGQYYTNQTRMGIEKLWQKNNQMQINLQWVPGHMNIYSDEKADEKAKFGSRLRTVHHEAITSLSFLKRKVKECCLDD